MNDLLRPLSSFGDEELAGELRAMATWLEAPATTARTGSPDPARRARLRIEAGERGEPARTGRARLSWWPLLGGRSRPLRRSFVLALIALAVLVAIVGAIGFGVPGIRIIFTGGPSPSPVSTASGPTPTLSPTPTATPTSPASRCSFRPRRRSGHPTPSGSATVGSRSYGPRDRACRRRRPTGSGCSSPSSGAACTRTSSRRSSDRSRR